MIGSHESLGWMDKEGIPGLDCRGPDAHIRCFGGRIGAEASRQNQRGKWRVVRVLGLWLESIPFSSLTGQ